MTGRMLADDAYGDVATPDRCPNCHRDTTLLLSSRRRIWPDLQGSTEEPKHDSASVIERVWICMYCRKATTVWRFFERSKETLRKSAEARIVWPERPPRQLPDTAPDEVRSLYREASIAEFAGALRGAAGLYRACVEALVKAQGLEDGSLMNKIDGLADKGVDADIVEDLHEARLLGNWSLHDGLTFDAAEVEDVALLIAHAVEELYVAPARREAMRKARATRTTKAQSAAVPEPE